MGFLLPGFTDILDILIVTIILYSIIIVVRKASGVEFLLALGLIATLYFLAAYFNLKMIMGILNGLQNFWMLALLILFQDEIKNGLAQFSKNKSLFSLLRTPVKISFTPILEAVSTFSDKRIGALLVFEKSQKLDDYISSGEIVDAKLSSKLLMTIFNTATLLHDGAVVIRDDKIYATKVVLPLSKNEEFGKTFGTRHLAAIGITEHTDAFCVIVSEQTGKISFTKDADIDLDISIEELLQKLTDETKEIK
ncbi:MAG: diadenylate cyclase CdaA [Candidatus Cloacimonetes bacterium]|nr:diadenylate cyclase CdaA [Candidatus Cloacimonadota bacterium]MDD4156570.1 diadenylate cyclase CdaA [Candidatus Cloacimonadota bacterium]